MAESEQFEAGVQLLVEGNDQRNFLEAFRRHLSLDNITDLELRRRAGFARIPQRIREN